MRPQHRRLAPVRRGLAVAAVVAVAAVGLPSPQSSAATMLTWTGTVTRVVDGDTSYIDIAGDGLGAVLVRNAGIQAVEKGQCHDPEATARYRTLAEGRTVRLQAERSSSSSLGRALRYVDIRNSDGSYTDLQKTLVREGHAMWLHNIAGAGEDARVAEYHYAAEQAMADRVGLWDDDFCGSGPYQSARLKLWVNYDADGSDAENVNGEFARILNSSSSTVSLSGWWFRDASHNLQLTFPSGTSIAPNDYLTIRVGKGTRTSRTFYLNSSTPIFRNLTPGSLGDSAFLFDLEGDVRAKATYPCLFACGDPAKGHVYIHRVNYDAAGDDTKNPEGEYIDIRTDASVDLSWRVLEVNGRTRELGPGSVLNPGETLRIHAGEGPSSRLVRYWGSDGPILSNAGSTVVLRTHEAVRLDSRSW